MTRKTEILSISVNLTARFQYDGGHGAGNDRVLIAVDSAKDYIGKDWKNLPSKN